ncbi:MAG: O-antigen ligase family protein [Candidatus Binatus sp.]|uniref:O-antigen ligase family protein n=1 Tax=Candidatus Binatus sp. TaxID=2811406 RepID=UPI003C787EF9
MNNSSRVHASRRRRTILMAGIVFLAVFMPLAFGAVHPWAYKIGEASVFALMLLWPIGRAARDGQLAEVGQQIRTFAIPIVAFLAFAMLQLLPIPPAAIRVLSPSAYKLYEQVFPGWPAQRPYAGLESSLKPPSAETAAASAATVLLPTVAEVKAGAPIPFAPKAEAAAIASSTNQAAGGYSDRSAERLSIIYSTRWRPLSIAPVLSWSGLVLFAACGALFVLVAFLPIGAPASTVERDWFVGGSVTVLLAVGFGIAALGLIQQATWNGRILWFFVPLDWGAPMLDVAPRASGPFVDPDHFAGFLAMIFPLALSGTFFGSPLVSARWSNGYRIACGVTSFVMIAAILMSQSRAGWIGLALGLALVMILTSRRGEDSERVTRSRRIALAGAVCMLILAMMFIGASGRSQVTARVQNSVDADAGLPNRVNAWANGLRIVEDFPAVGTGLRTWPELFTRYRARPWSDLYFSEAHNDYLQLIAETGIVGLALAAWFLLRAGSFIYRRFAQLPERIVPIQAALVAALAVMCVIEFFDFDLQIPAIAFFFAMILGLAVRVSWAWTIEDDPSEFQKPRGAFARIWIPISAVGLLLATFVQPSIAYPYNLQTPGSLAQAKAMLLLYPANTFSHGALTALLGDRMPLEERMREMQIALALDPMNPYTRDAYMRELAGAGRGDDALKQMELSVYNSPAPRTHPYMSDRLIGWLSPDERDAIGRGIKRATAEQVPGALEAAATFYDGVGKYSDEASLYADAAQHAPDSHAQYLYLVSAAAAAARGADFKRAQSILEQAIAIEPDQTRAYYALTMNVYVPQKDIAGVKHTVAQAIDNGIDSYEMEALLAAAAQTMGDLPAAIEAIKQIAVDRPDSFEVTIRLGELYGQNHDFNQAVIMLTRAIQLRPDSALAYYSLAEADEQAYDYAGADKAYARAAQLAPDNQAYKTRADDFHKRVDNAPSAQAGTQTP